MYVKPTLLKMKTTSTKHSCIAIYIHECSVSTHYVFCIYCTFCQFSCKSSKDVFWRFWRVIFKKADFDERMCEMWDLT